MLEHKEQKHIQLPMPVIAPRTASQDLNGRTAYLLAFSVPLAILLLHAFYYYPFFVDDAYISLRYAERLLNGKGLTWNDGYYVEGYSNLLWVLLVSLLGLFAFDLVAAARAVCLVSSIATMLAFVRYAEQHWPGRPVVSFWANVVFACTAPVAVWSVGGLEGTLIMALLAWAFVVGLPLLEAPHGSRAAVCGVLLGLVCITRPEGAFFTVMVAAGFWLFTSVPRMALTPYLVVMCLVSASFYAAQLGFRLIYYGEWMPNTYYAKVSEITYARLLSGYLYTIKATASLLPLVLVVCLQFEKLLRNPGYRRQARVTWFSLSAILAWLVALTLAGGDMEPSYRHLLPVVPLLIITFMECTAIEYSSGNKRHTNAFYVYILVCFIWLQHSMEENDKHFYTPWERQAAELGRWLGTWYHETQPTIAVTHAGAIPYYSKLPTIDALGLNDLYLTKHRGPLFGHGLLGHELFSGDYVLSRKPDAVILFTGRRNWLYSNGLVRNPEFLRQYKAVDIVLPSYSPTIWVRRDSAKMKLPHLPE